MAQSRPVRLPAQATGPQYTGEISNPGGVAPLAPNDTAVATDGTVYASDESGTRIVSVDPTTGAITVVSPASNGWSHPSGMFLDPDQQHLWVADKDNNRVVEIDVTTGAFTQILGGSAILNAPESLTVDSTGVYVNDTYNYRVVKFSLTTGQIVWTATTCEGVLIRRNRGITFGSDGNLYVADTDNARVVVLDPTTGDCLNAFGTRGNGPGQFSEPRGIAADGTGGLWIAENGDARIEHVTQSGAFIWSSPTTFGSAIGQFRSPHGVEVVGNEVYVSDTYNYRIAIYTQAADGSATLTNTISEPPPAAGGFNGPYSLAYDPSGDLYVVDHYNSRVEKFNPDGSFALQFGGEGTPQGSFNFPRGILVMPGGTQVMVCDSENHRMQVFTSSGTYVSTLTPNGTSFLRPQEIALGPDGTLWVADTNHHRVLNVDMSGNVLNEWTTNGGQFTPRGIVVDPAGNVYVSDNARNVVEEFTPSGTLIAILATKGNGPTEVSAPDGLALTTSGGVNTLYIADTGNGRIVEMTTAGVAITTFGSKGSGPGQFDQPNSVAVGPTGQIAVSDQGNNRVSLWQS